MSDPISSLKIIIENEDCQGLEKWERNYGDDMNLKIPDELYSQGINLGMGCIFVVTGNMFDNSQNIDEFDKNVFNEDQYLLEKNRVSDLIENRECKLIAVWNEMFDDGNDFGFTNDDKFEIYSFESMCEMFGIEDQFGNITLKQESVELYEKIMGN